MILIISHRVANPLPKSIKDAVALQCGAHHFSEHSEGRAGRVNGSVLGAGRRTCCSSFSTCHVQGTGLRIKEQDRPLPDRGHGLVEEAKTCGLVMEHCPAVSAED